MKRILAIDPGTTESGFVVWDGTVVEAGVLDNPSLIYRMKERSFGGAELVAIEMIASYGMPVGREVFETCVWIGRMVERAGFPAYLIYRKDIKMHLCGTAKAKDGNIRASILDRFGGKQCAIGNKRSPGPLYGVSGHLWAALAVALFVEDSYPRQHELQGQRNVERGGSGERSCSATAEGRRS